MPPRSSRLWNVTNSFFHLALRSQLSPAAVLRVSPANCLSLSRPICQSRIPSAVRPFSQSSRFPTMSQVERITEQLEKPVLDDRSYRVVRLGNKLEALLVHDPDTDKASAAVNVNVGNFSDDDNMPGMAHAVEHLLFMGTTKFPKENSYNQFLTSHSGYSNAYTASTETNYFFELSATTETGDQKSSGQSTPAESTGINGSSGGDETPPLYGALDRFAQFFISPLFLESTLDRELRAVDSENKKNLQSDLWRLMQLNKSLSNPKHPYHHFSTGNFQTLKVEPEKRGLDVRREFIDFYERHYSANRMKLTILGRESLDELEQWVGKLFSSVRNKDLPQNRWDDVQPFSKEDMCTQVLAKPVMETRSIDIYFPFMDEEHLYDSHPSRYISHLIGHEGPGSILAYIKAKGWANGLSSGVMPVCPGSAFFTVSVRLTKEGLKQHHEVTKVVFQYIAMIKEREPEKWIFDEMKDLAEVDFRFRQKTPASRFTSKLSSVMQQPLPREWLLSGSLLREFNPEKIKEALSYLRADNFRTVIVTPDYDGEWDGREKWYGTEYKSDKISAERLADIRKALATTPETRLPELHMPHRNEFVPTRLSVEKKEVAEPAKAPKLIRHDDRVRLWFKKDDRFWVPKATVYVTLRNPLVWTTPGNLIKAKMYCELVKDALVEYSYDAELAGLDYHLSASVFGLDISVAGYNDKMSVLLEKVLLSMRDLVVDPGRFYIVKERMSRAYRNAEYQQPFFQVGDFTRYLTTEKTWTNDQYAAELEYIEPEDVANFFPQILRQTHIEVLAHGNLYKEDALKMTNSVESIMKGRPLPQTQWNVRRNIVIPPGSNYVYDRQLKDPANVNHCIEYYLFIGRSIDSVLRSKLLLFAQMTDEPAFDQLRSKEQLGYVVWSGPRYSATTIGYRVIIQSERTAPYLESRIDAFLTSFGTALETMTDEEFEGHKRSIINKRLEKLKNLGSETNRFWTHIGSEYFDFLQHETDAAYVRKLTKPDVVEFYKQFIDPQSPSRAKLSIHLNAQAGAHATETGSHGQRSQLTSLLAKQLDVAGFAIDVDRLGAAIEKSNVTTDDKDKILSVFGTFLVSEMSLSEEQAKPVLEKAELDLGVHAQELGIANGEQPTTNGTVKPAVTYITNVPEFKAHLPVSAGPTPVTDLSEFEDLEPKL